MGFQSGIDEHSIDDPKAASHDQSESVTAFVDKLWKIFYAV